MRQYACVTEKQRKSEFLFKSANHTANDKIHVAHECACTCTCTYQSLSGDSPPRPSTLSELSFGVLVTSGQKKGVRIKVQHHYHSKWLYVCNTNNTL